MSTNSLSAKESRHLCISGLPKVDEGELLRLFSEFGEVESIKLLSQNDPNGGLSACIDFYKDDDAVAAFKADIKIKGSEVKKSFCDQSSKCKEHPHFTTASGDEEHRSTTSSTSSSSSTSSDARSSSVSSTTDSEGETEVVKQKQSPENESLILKFMNLSHHRSESSVHEALYQKCCSYSSKPKVKLYGEDEQRYALVKFQSLRERDNALNSLHGISIFGVKLKVTIFYNADFPSGGRELNLHVSAPSHEDQYSSSLTPLGFSHGNPFISPGNEFDPSATRSLFVGNIHKNVSIYDLRDVFQRYGHILDVEIKKMSGNATYGFVLFFNLLSAINAKKAMDGAQLGRNRIRVGFGKGTPSKVLWIDGIDASLNETQVKSHFSKYGTVVRIGIDRSTYTAMVQFDKVDEAKDALSSVKGSFICNTHSKIMADFANRDAKAAFFTHLESMDGQSQSFYSRPPPTTAKSLMRHRPFAVLPGLPRPPLDYYSYQYVEPDYYGYRSYDVRAAEVAPRHYSQYGVGSGDYEDDLREFSKKRERERERRIDKEERKRSQFSSREYSSSDTENPRHKKQPEEKQKRKTKKIRKCSTSSKSDDDCSTCVRTKSDSNTLKDKSCGGAPLSVSTEKIKLAKKLDDESMSKEDESDFESAVTINKSVHKSKLEGTSKIDSDSVYLSNKNVRKEPKVIITYDEDENDEVANFSMQPSPPACIASQLAASDFQEQMEALPTCIAETLIEQSDVQTPTGTSDTSKRDEKQLEDNEPEALLHSTDGRPKISIAWKGKPLKLDRLSFLQPPVSSVSTDVSTKEEKLESDVSSNEDCDYDKPNSHTCKYSDLSNRMQDENAPEYKLFLNDKSTNVTHSRSLIKDSMRSTQHSKSTRHDLASKIKKKERTSTSINKEHKDVSSASSRASDSHDHRMSHFSQCISKNGSSHSSGSPALYRQKSPLPHQPHSPMSRPHSPNHQRSRSPVFRRQRSPTLHSSHSSPRRPHSPTSRSSRSPTTHHSPSSYRSRSPLSHRPRSPVSHRFRSPISGRSQRSPVSSRSRRSPVLGRSHRSPVSGRSQRSPVSARSQRSPVSARSQRSPVSGRSQRSPFSGRSQRSPVSVRSHRSPVSVRSQKSLTSSRSQKSPVSGRSQRSPVSGRSQKSPVSGRSQRNLVSGRSRRSPVSGRSQSSGRSRRSPVSDQSQRSPFSGRPHSPRSWHLQSHASQDPVSRYSRSPSPCLHKRRSQTPILKTENLISHETRKSRHIRSGQNNKQNTSSELPNTSMCKYSPPHHARHSRSPHRVEQLHDYSPRRSSRFRASPPVSSSSRSPTSYQRKVSNDQTKSKGHYSKSASPVNQHTPPSSPIPSSKTSEVNSSLCPPDLPCPSASQNITFYPDDDISEVNIITDDVHIEVDEDLSQSVFLEQLLNKYPVVWQGSLSLKNDAALLQFHFLSGNDNLPSMGLPHDMGCKIIGTIPTLHISQRMKLEPLHLKGIEKCMEKQTDHCLLLGLPCGLDSYDIAKQTSSLQKSIISYLWLKQAAGIINLSTEEDSKIALHIFPPSQFSRSHLSKVAPDMLAVALDDAHLFIVLSVAVNDNS